MCWQASAWAKGELRQLGTLGERLLLMVLADCAKPKTWEADVSQATLATVCRMSRRHVIRSADGIITAGLMERARKGNQWATTIYRLNVTPMAQSPADVNVTREAQSEVNVPLASQSPEVNVPYETSECATQVTPTSLTSEEDKTPQDPTPPLRDYSHVLETLSEIEGWVSDDAAIAKFLAWATRRDIPPALAEDVAGAMRDQLEYDPVKQRWMYQSKNGRRPHLNLISTCQGWINRRLKDGDTGGRTERDREESQEDRPYAGGWDTRGQPGHIPSDVP